MLMYGINLSNVTINNDKAEKFLAECLNNPDVKDIAKNYFDNKEDGHDVESWARLYDNNEGSYGLAACIADIIRCIEKIDISSDDVNGMEFLGLPADVPWNYQEKTRMLTETQYENILSKYVSYFVDEPLEIRWWHASDDADY